jgi:hypothetical protein
VRADQRGRDRFVLVGGGWRGIAHLERQPKQIAVPFGRYRDEPM